MMPDPSRWLRPLSLIARRWDSRKDRARVLRSFEQWRRTLESLDPARPVAGRLLLVRLDDIGDYVLFRNQLSSYRQSHRWRSHHITLLGNAAWKELFTTFDAATVDEVIWVDKQRYLASAAYRAELWPRLRAAGIETVIAPSRTRPLLLDDLCRIAAAPCWAIGSANLQLHPQWCVRSDALYQERFDAPDPLMHEFRFNASFAAWACGRSDPARRPHLEWPRSAGQEPYLLCFLGASTRSRCWPAARWIELLRGFSRRYSSPVILAAHRPDEIELARTVARAVPVARIVGQGSLLELVRFIADAQAIVTHDTSAVHLAVATARPTVIVANGVNYRRFTDYRAAGVDNVLDVYPPLFARRRARRGEGPYHYPEAVTADMATIAGDSVLEQLETLWNGPAAGGSRADPLAPTEARTAPTEPRTDSRSTVSG